MKRLLFFTKFRGLMNSLLHQSLQAELRIDVPECESEILDAIRYVHWHYVERILDVRDADLN